MSCFWLIGSFSGADRAQEKQFLRIGSFASIYRAKCFDASSGIKYLDFCALRPSILRFVQEPTAGFFRDCSAVQVLASKRLHKLEHITLSYIQFCGGRWEGSTWDRNESSKYAETTHPKTRQKTTLPKRPTAETTHG